MSPFRIAGARRRCPWALAFALLSAAPGRAAIGFPPGAESWFKWGDYDSLIAELEPLARDTSGDSALLPSDRARAQLYLGVAYHATGQRHLADSAFCRASRTDCAIALDRFYVAEDILDHFRAIASQCRIPQPATAPASSLASAAADTVTARRGEPGEEKRPPMARSSAKTRGNRALWWGVGGAAAAVALAGGAILLLQPAERRAMDSVTVIDGR